MKKIAEKDKPTFLTDWGSQYAGHAAGGLLGGLAGLLGGGALGTGVGIPISMMQGHGGGIVGGAALGAILGGLTGLVAGSYMGGRRAQNELADQGNFNRLSEGQYAGKYIGNVMGGPLGMAVVRGIQNPQGMKTALMQTSIGDDLSSSSSGYIRELARTGKGKAKQRAQNIIDRKTERLEVAQSSHAGTATALDRVTSTGKMTVTPANIEEFQSGAGKSKQIIGQTAGIRMNRQVEGALSVAQDAHKKFVNQPGIINAAKRGLGLMPPEPTSGDIAPKSVRLNANTERAQADRLSGDLDALSAKKTKAPIENPITSTKTTADVKSTAKAVEKNTLSRNLLAFAKKRPLATAGIAAGAGFIASQMFD